MYDTIIYIYIYITIYVKRIQYYNIIIKYIHYIPVCPRFAWNFDFEPFQLLGGFLGVPPGRTVFQGSVRVQRVYYRLLRRLEYYVVPRQ